MVTTNEPQQLQPAQQFREPTREELISFLRREVMDIRVTHKPRVSDKLKAVEIIAKLCGLNEAETVNMRVDQVELVAVIARLRGSGGNTKGQLTEELNKGGSKEAFGPSCQEKSANDQIKCLPER